MTWEYKHVYFAFVRNIILLERNTFLFPSNHIALNTKEFCSNPNLFHYITQLNAKLLPSNTMGLHGDEIVSAAIP